MPELSISVIYHDSKGRRQTLNTRANQGDLEGAFDRAFRYVEDITTSSDLGTVVIVIGQEQ